MIYRWQQVNKISGMIMVAVAIAMEMAISGPITPSSPGSTTSGW